MKIQTEAWLEKMMTYHLGRLILLHLDFSPSEKVDLIRDLWCEAFTRAIGRVDQNLDAVRIEQAFFKFEKQAMKWPSPAMVIDLMPRRPDQNMLPHDPRQHEEVNPNIAKMTRAVVDLSEGNIDKEEFDRIMEQFAR